MVVLPAEFVATRLPGYFWNTVEQKLYSIKVTGELKPMTFSKGFVGYSCHVEPGYRVSHKGVRRTMTLNYLKTLAPVPTTKFEQIGLFRE